MPISLQGCCPGPAPTQVPKAPAVADSEKEVPLPSPHKGASLLGGWGHVGKNLRGPQKFKISQVPPRRVDPGYLSVGGDTRLQAFGNTTPWPGSAGRSALPWITRGPRVAWVCRELTPLAHTRAPRVTWVCREKHTPLAHTRAPPAGPSTRPYEEGSSPRVPGRTWAGSTPGSLSCGLKMPQDPPVCLRRFPRFREYRSSLCLVET